VVSRRQLLGLGLSPGAIGALLDSGRWAGLHPGVYATFTGPVPASARVWGAVLYPGEPAAVGGATALWLWDVLDVPAAIVTVCIPQSRRLKAPAGVRIEIRRRFETAIHPAVLPPRLRVEEALLDVVDATPDPVRVVDLLLRAVQSRHTTPDRLRSYLAARSRHRWRGLIGDLLADAHEGVQSPLERRWLSDVERRHGLPKGERNRPETGTDGRRRYRDVRYRRWNVIVELDGQEAHPRWAAFRDRHRDNAVAVGGVLGLRYGWHETVGDPCGVAAEVVGVLRVGGWTGVARGCGPGCPVGDADRTRASIKDRAAAGR
jgi:hypothetical protein